MVSYDMKWSTRGSGRNYDSLNGFGAVIGHYSGMVLDYATCNRKCKKCDNNDGHVPDHDCRRNFYGSAKAMEPCVGKKLVVESEILKSQNVEVGVLIGDDDSSTIAACRSASNHPILKQSDKNHASKGVKKQLYGIQKKHKKLTKEGITYLHKCFTYAIAQNTGNSIAMTAAIRSIPHHAFNDHTQCGIWCGYIKNKENYDHRAVPGGFSNQNLFQDLKEVFYKLADNAAKFACGASSNRNESLNATMASKAPKSRCYSMSASADFRFSCSVAQKNLGEKYTQDIANQIQLSSGKHHLRHISKTDKTYLQRKARINTHQYKKKRMEQKKLRSILRYRRENSEGLTYESNCGLLTQPAVPIEEENNERDNESDIPIILFDLETSSLRRDCDILQIATKSVKKHFDIYINPTQQVSIDYMML
ncbi:uncharacterized protein LOC112466982 [Temnothorax curvispinosus]|uniref:Uncharacterized protein LOC112466982 n=1 Tax=Temnothorax curvispinosus TaxID=300111 RepID=A0A6J1R7Y7_9HYME|nr:uncharacterized protein LOC112466982 [Temnothorax curvispinosus]